MGAVIIIAVILGIFVGDWRDFFKSDIQKEIDKDELKELGIDWLTILFHIASWFGLLFVIWLVFVIIKILWKSA